MLRTSRPPPLNFTSLSFSKQETPSAIAVRLQRLVVGAPDDGGGAHETDVFTVKQVGQPFWERNCSQSDEPTPRSRVPPKTSSR